MKERAERIGGTLSFSSNGSGTTVELKMPVNGD
jgi:signal transduction histidine kinase